jgi:hypothetical protein
MQVTIKGKNPGPRVTITKNDTPVIVDSVEVAPAAQQPK